MRYSSFKEKQGVNYLEKPGNPGIIREFGQTWKKLEFSGNFENNPGNFFEAVIHDRTRS